MPPKGFRKDVGAVVNNGAGPSRKGAGSVDPADTTTVTNLKRKRQDDLSIPAPAAKRPNLVGNGGSPSAPPDGAEPMTKASVDFSTLTLESLNAYLNKYELVPPIWPPPSSMSIPPAPVQLVNPPMISPRRNTSPSPSVNGSGSGRPRRGSESGKDGGPRRRSSRLMDEESGWRTPPTPILADIEDAKEAAAAIAQRHFERQTVSRESELVTQFVYAIKTRERALKILPM